MSRAYLRFDPALYERKVMEQGYSLPLFAAFVGVICLAEHQPKRGRFRNERVLKALLGPSGRYLPELVKRCDVIAQDDGSLYVDGWEEWQEGDWKVGERVTRIRNRKRTKSTPATVTPVTVPTVDTPSEHSVIDGAGGASSPLPPPSGGDGKVNPRANGTNPRAIAAALTRKTEEAAKERKARRQARYLAYGRGEITEAQRIEMDEADAPLSAIPGRAS